MKHQLRLLALCTASALATGISNAQNETHKFVASDAGFGEAFGHSVATDGTYAIVGARNAVANGVDTGAVYVYDVATGAELYVIEPADGMSGDKFGFSVALENGIAVIGSPHHDVMGMTMVGSAYVYDLSTGLEIGRLVPPTMVMMGHFGIGVAMDNGKAAVGAFTRNPKGTDSGEAFVFDIATSTMVTNLVAPDGAAGDMLGWTVAIDGNNVLVGADLDDDKGTDSGSAYVFDATTGAQLNKFVPMDAMAGDRFGWKVALVGNQAIIGSHKHDSPGKLDTGAVYLFNLVMNMQMGKFESASGMANDEFGYSVDFDGVRVAVGAPYDDSATVNAGATYVFDLATQTQEYKTTASDAAMSDLFGSSIVVNGDDLVVGSVFDDDVTLNSGSAYMFDLAPPCWSKYCTVGDGSMMNTATLTPSGCDMSGSLTLMMMNAPANQYTFLLIGSKSGVVDGALFGAQGDLCVTGGSIGRYTADAGMVSGMGMFMTDISNSATGGPGFGIPNSGGASILAGETWNFQYWHRNPSGMPSGFSEAVSITFK